MKIGIRTINTYLCVKIMLSYWKNIKPFGLCSKIFKNLIKSFTSL